MKYRFRRASALMIAAWLCLAGYASAQAGGRYGFLRQVEGSVDLISTDSATTVEATVNYPVQVGDQLRVAQGGRLEAVLPDGALVRLGSNSEVRFGRLAEARDGLDTTNLLHLIQGEIQIEILANAPRIAESRIDTANATIFLLASGSYRVFSDGRSWTQVLVRSGMAKVLTEASSSLVDAGQQALIDGDVSARISVEAAAPLNSLELWADRLTTEARTQSTRGYVSPSLAYASAPLWRHGTWRKLGQRHVWRPRVAAGWRPYHSGWWIHTPSGLTWISTEPWGWVTYHYGAWEHASGLGWVWHPGSTYTPGAVVWHWGPAYVGWAPASPYSLYYPDPFYAMPPFGYFGGIHRFSRSGYGLPLYRWAGYGADASPGSATWAAWTFCGYDRFGYRDSHRYLINGADLARRGVLASELQAGLMTTETQALTPDLWESPQRLLERLRSPRTSRVSGGPALSPLGAAAIGSSQARSSPGQPIRRWDADGWRRDNRYRSSTTIPHQRDARFSRTLPYRGNTRRNRGSILRGGQSGLDRPQGSFPGLLRPSTSGAGNRVPSTRSRLAPPGPTRPATPAAGGSGRSRSNGSGGMSGSSRPSRPNGGPG